LLFVILSLSLFCPVFKHTHTPGDGGGEKVAVYLKRFHLFSFRETTTTKIERRRRNNSEMALVVGCFFFF
jgi:hypothetical protein